MNSALFTVLLTLFSLAVATPISAQDAVAGPIATLANTASITLADGTIVSLVEGTPKTIGKIDFALDERSIRIHNRGNPMRYGWAGAQYTQEPFYFDKIEVVIPDKTILAGISAGSRDLGGDKWLLVDPADYKHSVEPYYQTREGGTVYADSMTHHMLDGGDTFYARFSPKNDPWEWIPPIPADRYQKALEVLDANEAKIAQWPLLARCFDLYKLTPDSFNKYTPTAKRDMGWRLIPENFFSRYPGGGGGLEFVRGWYGFGDTHSAGEGFSNEHYSHDAGWLAHALREGDAFALTVGLHKVRLKCAYGLVDVDTPRAKLYFKGQWRNEKGSRRGIAMAPIANKEYDLSLVLATILVPDDPMFMRAAKVRREFYEQTAPQWNRAGGARGVGHTLENLWYWWKATGDPFWKTRAEQEIISTLTKNAIAHPDPQALWFQNIIAPQSTASDGSKHYNISAAEEAICPAAMAKWMIQEGLAPAWQAKVQQMLQFLVDNGSKWIDPAKTLRLVAYQMSVPPSPLSPNTYNTALQGIFWTNLRPAFEAWQPLNVAVLDGVERLAYTAMPVTIGVDYGPMGPSIEKWVGMFLMSGLK